MELVLTTPTPLPTMDPATSQEIRGQNADAQNTIPRRSGNTNASPVRKKAVNSFVLFRSMMSPIFPNWTQAERSRFIRIMWENEMNKEMYSLFGRVWTFIRDNSNYSCLSEFLSRAGAICDMPAPSSWLELYNMMLVTQTNGSVELLQVAPLAPGRIPNPRNISDYELLHQLILTGLPFERPAQLLAQMGENSLHVMTVNRQQDFSSHDETLGAAGRAATGFTQQMDYNPISTFAEILGVESSNSIFDSGVNIQNVSDITDFDDSAVLDAGPQTQYRFEWDTTTLHHAQPRAGTIDRIVIEDNPMMYEMDQPNMWENLGGQVTQRQYQLAYGKVQDMNMADFFMDTDFRGFPEMALE